MVRNIRFLCTTEFSETSKIQEDGGHGNWNISNTDSHDTIFVEKLKMKQIVLNNNNILSS